MYCLCQVLGGPGTAGRLSQAAAKDNSRGTLHRSRGEDYCTKLDTPPPPTHHHKLRAHQQHHTTITKMKHQQNLWKSGQDLALLAKCFIFTKLEFELNMKISPIQNNNPK